MQTFQDRLRSLIDTLGITKTKFAEDLHVSSAFVSMLCSGKSQPSDRTIADICRKYNVSETWLRTGAGEMRQKLTRNQEIAEFMGVVIPTTRRASGSYRSSANSALTSGSCWPRSQKKWPRTNNRPRPIFLFPRLCDQLPHESPDQIQIRICGQPQQALDLFQQQIPFHFHKCLHSSTKISSIFCLLLPLRFSSI